ncbi:hypothetical protein GN157_14330, partial [Flavobacterium rakeshii]|nr:hypothetical protein [Flavobacterium rakeshii]
MGRIKFTFYALLFLVFGCNFGYALSDNEMLLPPANDDCAGATPLTVNSTEICASGTTATFAQATASALGATCTAQNGADVWYEFTATSTAHTIALSNFSGTPQPMVIVLYDGDCTGLTMLSCSQNNVLNASGLIIGDTYKVKIYFNTTSPSLTNTFLVCVTTPPPPSNNNQTECLITTVNYDFELPNLTWSTYPTFVNHNVVQGWRTTASDQTMEFWQEPNYENVPAYSGDQFIELNANVVSGVYQDYNTPQSTVFNYGFAHRGRQGTDTCQLLAGPPGGPYTPVTTVSTGNTAWSYNTGTYTVPDNQPITRFILQSVSSVGGASVGNFLDAISFTANNGIISPNPFYMDCGDLVASLEAAGTGTWSAHGGNPSTVTFSDPTANNVDISGFSVQGIYYFDWTTEYCTSTIEVSYTGPYPSDPVITDITYCQGQTAVPIDIPVDEPGYTMLYYLNGVAYSNPTPDTSVVGSVTYYVIQESDAGCQTPAYPLVVTVNPGQDPVTDFTLPEALCTSDGTVTPTTGTDFTTGGTFSAPAEVVIDPGTGEINLLASTPGIYDITYSVEEDIENCLIAGSSTVSFIINAAPVLMPVTPLELCDDATNDGVAEFDLAPAIAEALNNQTGYTVTIHLTEADAEANLNPQSQPLFTNMIAGGQSIYMRVVEDGTTTDCYSIEEIQLFVHPLPTISAPITNYVQCDQTDPDANDGIEEFDLTTKDTEITGGNVDYAVSYYMTYADADSATNVIANPATYQNTAP